VLPPVVHRLSFVLTFGKRGLSALLPIISASCSRSAGPVGACMRRDVVSAAGAPIRLSIEAVDRGWSKLPVRSAPHLGRCLPP